MPADDDTQNTVLQDQQDDISAQVESEIEQFDDEPDDDDDEQQVKEGYGSYVSMYRKLTTLIAVFAILIGFILSTYQATQTGKPKVVYADRYSEEHKFRPAASPVITETLKDGRVRIRGAEPTMSTPPPKRTVNTKPKRKRKVGKKVNANKKI